MKVFDIVFTVLIPLVLLVAGWMMQFHPPKKQNAWIGYRTTRSMKNAVGYFFMSMKMQTMVLLGNIVLQMAVLICTIFQTDRAIRTQFDETGKRKDTTHD